MNLRTALGTVRRATLFSIHQRLVPLGDRGPIVSFAFDDFPRTAYTVGRCILRSFGARGTYYVAIGLMNTSNKSGDLFQLEDLHSLVADGHELASHTFSHLSCRAVSLCAFRRDVQEGREAIRRVTNLPVSCNFAYPYGEVTLAAKKALGQEMASCRGTYGGINGPDLDLNLLRANSLYGGLDQFARVERLILENEKQRGWLIFYSHDVCPSPSRFGCTPSLLEAAVSFAFKRGSRISTVAEVLADPGLRQSARP